MCKKVFKNILFYTITTESRTVTQVIINVNLHYGHFQNSYNANIFRKIAGYLYTATLFTYNIYNISLVDNRFNLMC